MRIKNQISFSEKKNAVCRIYFPDQGSTFTKNGTSYYSIKLSKGSTILPPNHKTLLNHLVF